MATINSANTYVTPYSTGEINYPGQCSFMAYLSSTASNVTGDTTEYIIIPDTELWDIGSNYDNTTGIFTAPKTAIYQFTCGMTLGDLGAANSIILLYYYINASDAVYVLDTRGSTRDVNNQLTVSVTFILSLTASDAIKMATICYNGTKIVDVIGSATIQTYFGGILVE